MHIARQTKGQYTLQVGDVYMMFTCVRKSDKYYHFCTMNSAGRTEIVAYMYRKSDTPDVEKLIEEADKRYNESIDRVEE